MIAAIRILLSLLLLVVGWEVYGQWRALQISRAATGVEAIHEAIRYDPEEPDYYFQLGILYRDQLEYLDLSASRKYLERALDLNPHNWRYWLEIGRCYELLDLLKDAEKAYVEATALNPRSAAYRWRLAHFYLRTKNLPASLEQPRTAMKLDPSYRQTSLAVLWKAGVETDSIEAIWPRDLESQLLLLRFLVEKSKHDGEERQPTTDLLGRRWNELLGSPGDLSIARAIFYIDYLMSQQRHQEARLQWIRLARRNGMEDRSFQNKENFIWNGNFENPVTSTGLDWKLSPAQAFTIVQSEKEGLQSSTALRIRFHGTENIDFHGLKQQVLVQPGRVYEFSFHARSQRISSEQGLYFQVVAASTGKLLAETEPILGTTSWKHYSAPFRVPAKSHRISVALRRRRSRRIDGSLRGSVWLDEVRVTEADARRVPGWEF